MTATVEHLPRAAVEAGVQDPIGARLEDLRQEWGASLAVECSTGRLVSHALLPDVPQVTVEAVLGRSAQPLHSGCGPSRSSSIGHGVRVVSTSLAGWSGTVTIVQLERSGWLWVMHRGALSGDALRAGARGICEALEGIAVRATDLALMDELDGCAWPPGRQGAAAGSTVAVVRSLDGPIPAVDLHGALRQGLLGASGARITAVSGTAYLVLDEVDPRAIVDRALHRAGAALRRQLVAVMAPVVRDLAQARAEAEKGLAARQVAGRCLTLADCRPYVVLPHLLLALGEEPTTGGSPLEGLDATTAETLLAWLDHFGDVAAVAKDLNLHVNTIRYRLKQVAKTVRVDLQDPVARIDLHLRLHRARIREAPGFEQ